MFDVANPNVSNPFDVIEELFLEDDQLLVFVSTNNIAIQTAVCMRYDNVLKEFAESVQSDLIISPSSTHEVC